MKNNKISLSLLSYLYPLFSLFTLFTYCLPLEARPITEVFTYTWDGGRGRRILKVEALQDDLFHFETFEGHDQRPNQPIWVSPMVDETKYSNFLGPNTYKKQNREIETNHLKVFISEDLRHIHFFDKQQGIPLTTLRSEKLNEAVKTMHIEKLAMKNVYGVGNLFYDVNSSDGDWVNRDWNARGHGNFRFGLDRRDTFHEGGPSVSQFPMIFVLGDRVPNKDFANYGLFFDQVYRMSWNFRDVHFENSIGWTASMWGDQVRWFFFAGKNLKDIRKNYLNLVGHPPVPPKNIFGHWTSEFGYDDWNEIESDVKSLRKNDFPLEGVALDLQWFGGSFGEPSTNKMGHLQFDPRRFPDPQKRIKEFFDQYGIRFMTIEESYVDKNLDDFKAMANHEYRKNTFGFNFFSFEPYKDCYLARHNFHYDTNQKTWNPVFLSPEYKEAGNSGTKLWWGTGGMIDWSNPAARRYWHQLKRHPLAKLGIQYHWLDLGEPEMYYEYSVYHGLPTLGKFDHGSIHNLYALLWTKGIQDGYQDKQNQDSLKESLSPFFGKQLEDPPRHFIMSRAGTIGLQRTSALWSGDVFSNFENLRAHLATQKDLSLLGIDYYSSDTGGFFHRGRLPEDKTDREIVTQWAANTSLLDNPTRPHGWAETETTDEQHKVNRFTLDARGDLDSNRANIRRKYELLPYVYSLAHLASRTGEPMYPPPLYYFQEDQNLRKLGNIKMIGPFLLFGVVAAHNERARRVYLPKGKWIDYENLRWYESNGEETPPIPLFRRERVPSAELREHPNRHFFMVPLFAKAGAIIPKMHVDQYTMNVDGTRSDGTRRDELILRVFSSEVLSRFTLFEDDGISESYKKGRIRTTQLSQQWNSKNRSLQVVIDASQGDFAHSLQNRENIIEAISPTEQTSFTTATVNGRNCLEKAMFQIERDLCWIERKEKLTRIGTRVMPVRDRKEIRVQY